VYAFQHSAQFLEDSLGEDAGDRQDGVGCGVLLLAQVLLAVASCLLGLHLLQPSLDLWRYNSLLLVGAEPCAERQLRSERRSDQIEACTTRVAGDASI
jgi:hypothetical protein